MTILLPHNFADWPTMMQPPRDKPRPPDSISAAVVREFVSYNRGIGPVDTADVRRISSAMLSVAASNENATLGARQCLLVDGPAGMGKSQAVVATALRDTRDIWQARGRSTPMGQVIPWIYVEATAAGQGKALMRAVCEFTGLPTGPRDTADELLVRLRKTAPLMGVRGVIVDDAHMLRVADKDSRRLTDFLKSAITGLPVTFVFVGAGLRESALLRQGGAGYPASEQIARRSVLLEMSPWDHTPIDPGTPDEMDAWARLVVTLNSLLAHPSGPGQLRLARSRAVAHLHKGSAGHVGVMIDWVKAATVFSVKQNVPLDRAALDTAPALMRHAS